MRRTLSLAVAVAAILSFAIAGPVGAIRFGSPDAGEHPYVGQLLFFVPDAPDPRFSTPGGWFTCSGTLLDSTHVVTAGHCTFGVGLNGVSTTHNGADTTAAQGGVGGNDVWVDFEGSPDFSILPPSAGFVPNGNAARYQAWKNALNASSEWHRGTATPHPLYDDNLFFGHDAGVVTLSSPVNMPAYGQIAPLNWLNRYASTPKSQHRFETVGYGLERVQGKKEFGGDTRMKAEPMLINLHSNPANSYMVISDNTATGGTCFGDSGGPTFDNTSSRVVVAVSSWAQNTNCTGKSGVYRLDQPDDLAFLATFGIHP